MTAVYQLTASCHDAAGNFFQNVFHYQLSEGGTATGYEYANALIKAFELTNEASYLALMGNDILLDFYMAKKVTAGGSPSATDIMGLFGTAANPSISTGFAADIAWISAAATNRPGHTFLAGIPETQFNQGQFQGAYKATATTFITAMLAQLTLAGALGTADFGQFTRKTGGFNQFKHGILKPKVAGMTKRTLPVI